MSMGSPNHAPPDQAIREIRQRAARAVDHLETPRCPAAYLEAGELGLGIALLHLTVDVGLDSPKRSRAESTPSRNTG
jgi:hypothetical protein